jgi:hypothetical protein
LFFAFSLSRFYRVKQWRRLKFFRKDFVNNV